jgi:hypothetical protein
VNVKSGSRLIPRIIASDSSNPMRFALIETGAVTPPDTGEVCLELVPAKGDRLRIRAGVDGVTLRTVRKPCGYDPPASQRPGVSLSDTLQHCRAFLARRRGDTSAGDLYEARIAATVS